MSALDTGCGGGLLAEEFARLGCKVTGVDPSQPSVETAESHARESGLTIDYQVAGGEKLPFADIAFDIVYCCDVLEHVDDLDQVIAESARVLKSGGILRLFGKMRRFKRGEIAAAEVTLGSFGESADLRISYMGYALKQAAIL